MQKKTIAGLTAIVAIVVMFLAHSDLYIALSLLLLPFVIFAGFVVAIAVYIFTKNRELTVIGFVLGTIANLTVFLLLLLYQIGVMELLGGWSLLLSAGISFSVVAVPIILLSKRKSKAEG